MTKATLRQVAELAGVSVGTASQALNNRASVAPDTRARVMDAAVALGYHVRTPPPLAGANPVSVVGMLTKHDAGTPIELNVFYFHIQAGIERECRERQISLMYANLEVDESNRPLTWPPMVGNRQVDALILLGAYLDQTVSDLTRLIAVPIVLVDGYTRHEPLDSVLIDNAGGATTAMEHLLSLGHRRIGLIGSHQQSSPGVKGRRLAYLNTLRSRGINEAFIENSGLTYQQGYNAGRRLLERAPEITAIFACNDLSALGAIDAAGERGLDVPGQLSVIGFDNIDQAKDHRPPLTTIHVHKTWMGTIGVRRLLERVRDPDMPKTTTTIATQLLVRQSTTAPRRLVNR